MSNHPLGAVLSRLRSVLGPAEAETTDRALLQRFVAGHEEAAFGELVRRHGPMVLGVCRRILGDAHAAEDAFQATFLVLVRRARAVPWRESLGGWLHGTARRVALRARRAAGERRGVSPPWLLSRRAYAAPLAESDPSEEAAARELRRVLDQELQGLPAKYRAPLVLCDLEGKTHEQAARELGWPKGSVAKRLNGGRERLRARLVRRGVALSAGALTVFTANEITAAPPVALAAAALLAAHGGASTTATALAKGAIQAMWITKITTAVVLTLTLAVAGTLAGVAASRISAAREVAPAPAADPAPPAAENKDSETMPIDKAVLYHVGPVQGVQTDALPDGAVIAKDRPESVDDNVHLYLVALAESKKQKLSVPPGPHLAILAVGPVLNSPDEAAAVSLKRHGDKLDLEMAYTSAIAEGKGLKRNVPSRPLVQVPVDLTAGSYRLTVTWQARKSLPAGDAWNIPPTVSTCEFSVTGEGRQESKAIRVNGAEFTAFVTARCVAPAAGASRDVEIGLRIANVSDHPVTFKRMDTVSLSLTTPDGKALEWTYQRLRTIEVPPVQLGAGKEVTLPYDGRLAWSDDGKTLRLGGTDDSAGHWRFEGLRPGKYLLTVGYDTGQWGDGKPAFWVGKVQPEPVAFEILDASNASKPVRVKGLEFTAQAPARIAAPPPGGKTDVDIEMRVVNISDNRLLLTTFDVIQPRLITPDGKEIEPEVRGRKDTPKITPLANLAPGDGWTWRPEAHLQWTTDRATLQLTGPDGRGVAGEWSFPTLHPGKYRLVVEYVNKIMEETQIPNWVGTAATEPVDFEIVAP